MIPRLSRENTPSIVFVWIVGLPVSVREYSPVLAQREKSEHRHHALPKRTLLACGRMHQADRAPLGFSASSDIGFICFDHATQFLFE